nr:uncharacterized protein K02A2.6-like isoform X1 [Onthophagus taurus]XP_022905323.1 uncharacterized protein K02A2.6-like isoform X1 [Onthophagus taurus]XP_022905324.1 uncharacterized protein K02A2.6-like isoform X1 [Onthophagus taurus]XP_022905325.1 uncharacterized protein K02A2.6-like isoform X1 [Onthophagus taurus]
MIERGAVCEKYRYANMREPLIPHEIPNLPFQKIGSDILQYGKKSFLVMIDYLTKWLEIIPLNSKQCSDIINAFKNVLAIHGVPDIVVSDNMPYSSFECRKFAKEYDFEFKTSSPRYPRSNGLAERFVQTAKNILRKTKDLDAALMEYRNTPITGLMRSPAELLFSRKIKTKLPIVEKINEEIKSFRNDLSKKQEIMKKFYDKGTQPLKDLNVGERIVYRKNKEWQPAVVIGKHESPRSYLINTGLNVLKRNRQVLRKSVTDRQLPTNIEESTISLALSKDVDSNHDNNKLGDKVENAIVPLITNNEQPIVNLKTKPFRIMRKPTKFNDYDMY